MGPRAPIECPGTPVLSAFVRSNKTSPGLRKMACVMLINCHPKVPPHLPNPGGAATSLNAFFENEDLN